MAGHNKTLEILHEDGHDKFFTICSQCKKRWFNEKLTAGPETIIIPKSIFKPRKFENKMISRTRTQTKIQPIPNLYGL